MMKIRAPLIKPALILLIFGLSGLVFMTVLKADEVNSWMKVLSNVSEEMNTLDGKAFRAGYIIGSSIAQTKDGNFLVAGYVRPYKDHPVELALLKIDSSSQTLWSYEYGSRRSKGHDRWLPSQDYFSWAEIAPTQDGGAAIVFRSVLLRVGKDGKALWSKRYLYPAAKPSNSRADDFLLKSIVELKNGEFIVCGLILHHPANPKAQPDILLARLDASGNVIWAKEYPQLSKTERPIIRLISDKELILGADPRAILKLNLDGKVVWADTLYSLSFQRGPKNRPDIGSLLRYRSLGLASNKDIIFSGDYNLSSRYYTAVGALICRISQDGKTIHWSKRIHSPYHGGYSSVNSIEPVGTQLCLAGTSTEFDATESVMNNNALAMKMTDSGTFEWVRSIGKKKTGEAKSEYRNDLGHSLVPAQDGGFILAGATNAFAHPDPGYHLVINWQSEHYDLLLARLTSGGGIQNLLVGKYPRLMSAPDAGDSKKVEVLAVPIGINSLEVTPQNLNVVAEPCDYVGVKSQVQTQFSTLDSGTQTQLLTADFKILAPAKEGEKRVRLDGSLSTAPEGSSIVRYNWDFGGNSKGSGVQTSYEYPYESGATRDITLTVQDKNGREAQVTKKIVIGTIVRGKGIPTAFAGDKEVEYKVDVLTGDYENAGTDAYVYLNMYSPEDDKGQRYASGDMFLAEALATPYDNIFERGNLDTFTVNSQHQLGKFWNLDNVDHMILRHENNENKPGWYVQGVRVQNTITKKEWIFVPDQWLADDEPPDHKTWGIFKPVDPYPCGVFFKGGDKHSLGMTEASDLIYVLPEDKSEFYFTMLDRNSDLLIQLNGVSMGQQNAYGSGKAVPPFLKKEEWGVKYETSNLTQPTKFTVHMRPYGSADWKEETLVWVFPSNWAGYEKEARRVALLYPLANCSTLFNYGEEAKKYLKNQSSDTNLEATMTPILDYGVAALGIFADVPDDKLKWYLEYNTEQYTKYKVAKYLAKKTEKFFSEVVDEFFDILDTLVKARNWAMRLPDVIDISASPVYGKDLLGYLAEHDANFLQSLEFLRVL